jgi:hypothetical protein
MAKKLVLILALVVFLSGNIFAQNQSKHESGKMLLGINLGSSVTPSFSSVRDDKIPEGNYALILNMLGLNPNFSHFYVICQSFVTGGEYCWLFPHRTIGH